MSTLWVLPEELETLYSSEYAYEACSTASYILWALSGRKYRGLELVTERYDPISYNEQHYHVDPNLYYAAGIEGLYLPNRVFTSTNIRLRGTPVHHIVSVLDADGVAMAPDTCELVNRSTLSLSRAYDRPITVSYVYGVVPPIAARMAARALALEFAKAWSGDDSCALPERVTSVSREGVTYTILDNQQFIDELKTGIYQVDLFLKTVNPDKARVKSKVFNPEARRGKNKSNVQTPSGGWNIIPRQGG